MGKEDQGDKNSDQDFQRSKLHMMQEVSEQIYSQCFSHIKNFFKEVAGVSKQHHSCTCIQFFISYFTHRPRLSHHHSAEKAQVLIACFPPSVTQVAGRIWVGKRSVVEKHSLPQHSGQKKIIKKLKWTKTFLKNHYFKACLIL